MLSGDAVGKRLAMIRYLFDLGDRERVGQVPAVAVLCFHDAVELFLQLGLEHHGGETKDRAEFLQLFDALKVKVGALAGRDGLVRLNSVRIAVKHKAIDISTEEIMRCYERTRDFLAQNSVPVFGLDIFAAPLSDRIADDKVRGSVQAAEAALKTGEFLESVTQAAIAFDSVSRQPGFTATSIAPDRLKRFKSMIPLIQTAVSGKQTIVSRRSAVTEEECEFCIRFVVNVAAAIERRAREG